MERAASRNRYVGMEAETIQKCEREEISSHRHSHLLISHGGCGLDRHRILKRPDVEDQLLLSGVANSVGS